MLWPADKDEGVKFLYDKIHRMGNMQEKESTREFTKIIKLWIRSKGRKVVFNTFTQDIVNRPLAVYCIPYEQYSTLTTDNVASMAGVLRMYYKDV
jgi:hypothetical protein